MKSIVEQASTVLKAIEKGWIQAGKPCEFTVKVYEQGVKNFFGMSVEPAKICILFEDKSPKPFSKQKHDSHAAHHTTPAAGSQPYAKDRALPSEQSKKPVPTHKIKKEPAEPAAQPTSSKILWSDDLINACTQWLTSTLGVMNKKHCTFKIEAKKYHLIVTFNQPVLDDKEREKTLFRAFAHILMQSLRNRFKKGLRGYRIVLNANQE